MRSKPKILKTGNQLKLKSSFKALITYDATIDIGWNIGGRYNYNSLGGGWSNFKLSSSEGFCSVSVSIQDGHHNHKAEGDTSDFCFKKIKPVNHKY